MILAIPVRSAGACHAASLDDNLQKVGAEVVLTMAHELAPLSSEGSHNVFVDDGVTETPSELVDSANYGVISNKRPFTPQQAVEDSLLVPFPSVPKPTVKQFFTSPPSIKFKVRSSCSLPTAGDPADESFVKSLYAEADEGKINPGHVVVRRRTRGRPHPVRQDLLPVRVLQAPSPRRARQALEHGQAER
mmetsp:Transcript_44334/g.94355  ORF Transcript_44334/g.94355 Transcript_44334/m.94355 type:complete len:190 (+) Transcript_44334:40-609(+)